MVRNKPKFAPEVAIPFHSDKRTLPSNAAKPVSTPAPLSLQLRQFISTITADLQDLAAFHRVQISRTRLRKRGEYIIQRTNEIVTVYSAYFPDDASIDQEGRVDYLLLWNLLRRSQNRLAEEWHALDALAPLLGPWSDELVTLCESRQRVGRISGQDAASILDASRTAIEVLQKNIAAGKLNSKVDAFVAYRSLGGVVDLQRNLDEWAAFYRDYDPMFTWWTSKPWESLRLAMGLLARTISKNLVGVDIDDGDAIIGQPSGRESLIADLRAEVIPYSPEELIAIGEKEYAWCEKEMIAASRELGYGDDWRKALEHVKTLYVPPGEQIHLVHELAEEAIQYVTTQHDMVTIPELAAQTWRTLMLSPVEQKVAPFFLGGENILVAAPTSSMSHAEKMMSLRGNARPFARATVFHELLPGHHLQTYYMTRFRSYRSVFTTPFWMEGWSFYWEMILWERGFATKPEDRMGMLFWRMHRCARVIFSLRFHLGEMTPQECVDYLVDKVGHERATAEGEVRRSFNGDWTPLYQAGYMLGALQLRALRKEVVEEGGMPEKEFHDRIMQENCMPIELLRALITGEKLTDTRSPSWRFYDALK